jgi:hypothetical protein
MPNWISQWGKKMPMLGTPRRSSKPQKTKQHLARSNLFADAQNTTHKNGKDPLKHTEGNSRMTCSKHLSFTIVAALKPLIFFHGGCWILGGEYRYGWILEH